MSSTVKGTLIALSTLAPQYLLTQSSWQASQHRVKPQPHSAIHSDPANAQQDAASPGSGPSDLTQGSSEFAAHIEVLSMLISLLDHATADLALLVAASVYRLVA